MDEDTTRKVMIKYFESKGMKPIEQKGAGPDILINGTAVEVKGSRYNVKRMLKQIADYAYKYSQVALALPFDGLSLVMAWQTDALGRWLVEAGRKGFDVYIISSAQNNKSFYVFKCYRDSNMSVALSNLFHLMPSSPIEEEDTLNTFLEKVEHSINCKPIETVRKKFEPILITKDGLLLAGMASGEMSEIKI